MADAAALTLPGSLPTPRTRLIGRIAELAAARAVLLDDAAPLLTLTGPGGVGKTQLALTAAREVAAHVGDGLAFVDLTPLGDPDLVLPAVARALGVPDGGDRPLRERLVAAPQPHLLLLVLDNCEHLVDAVAALVAPLLAACPGLQVLATSRAPLRIRGEQEQPVTPLPLPSLDALDAPFLADNPAVRLFVERARAVDPRFASDAAALDDVAAVCRALDGLPLAIELAAAQTRVLTPAELRDRLAERLPLLIGGARDAPARQQTMRDAIAWSYDLLTADDQALFRQLAVFAGGFTLESAEALAPDGPAANVLPGLARLVEHNLVRRDDRARPTRYHLLETIREFALERLAACDELAAASDRHAAYILALAEQAAPALHGADQLVWLARLEAEHPNIRAALGWFVRQGDADALLRLTAALSRFWFIRGYPREGRAWLTHALAPSHPWSPALREALHGASMMASNQRDHRHATALAEQLLALARAHEDAAGIARGLWVLSFAATYVGEGDRAYALAADAVAASRELGDPHWLGIALNRLGIEAYSRGGYLAAQRCYAEAHALWQALGCPWEMVVVTTNLGVAAHAQGDLATAAAYYREGFVLLRDVGGTWMIEELLAMAAVVAADSGDASRAARLMGVTDALLDAIGFALAPFVAPLYERARTRLGHELGEADLASQREAGRRLSRVEALADAFAVVAAVADNTAPRGPTASAGLSARERQVLQLVAQGRSNREIAERLFISVPTVKRHLTNILSKLGLPSRSALTAYAHTHQLV